MSATERAHVPEWYAKGLRFECQKCGACCRGEPGYVWVEQAEVIGIAGFLSETPESVERSYARRVGGKTSLLEKPNGDCIFWEQGIGCRIYPVRPTQCRTFPFWKRNIESEGAWQRTAERCPGVGKGKLYTNHDIQRRLERRW